jgi:hypothetical protein
MTSNRRNKLVGLLIVIAMAIAVAFLTALSSSKSGEIAGALGSVVGGVIGALGSAAAVYIMLKGQRDDEIEKISAAVLREITELCKSPIGQLTACAGIQTGQIRCPKSELKGLFHTPSPIIYQAVADRIGRLPAATLVVTFYMQLQETRGLVAVIENSAPTDEIVTAGHIQVLADNLISQCQLARLILSSVKADPDREVELVTKQRSYMLKTLDEQLAAAKLLFPNAQSFKPQ